MMIRGVLFCAFVLASGTWTGAQISAGYVVEVRGEWVLNGSSPVKVSQKVPAGGAIRRRSSSADDRIQIANLRGQLIPSASQDCRNRCSGVVSLASNRTDGTASQDRSYASRILDAITGASLLPSWTNRQARGGALSDGVVRLDGEKIDIARIIKREGEQLLKWRRVEPDGPWNEPVRLSTTVLSGFQVGIYEFNLVRSNGGDFELVAASWVMVTSQEKYDSDLAAFNEMKKVVAGWGDAVSAEAKRAYLQGSLRAIQKDLE